MRFNRFATSIRHRAPAARSAGIAAIQSPTIAGLGRPGVRKRREAAILALLDTRRLQLTSVREIYRLLHLQGIEASMSTVYADMHRLKRGGVIVGTPVDEGGRVSILYGMDGGGARARVAAAL